MSEHCQDHNAQTACFASIEKSFALLQKDVEYLRRDQETILARFGTHVAEAEKQGGWHDRMVGVEQRIETMERQRLNDLIMGRWFMIGSGVISGGMVSGAIKVWAVLSKTLGV
jgi:hypothetical protein